MNQRTFTHFIGWLTFIIFKELEKYITLDMEFEDHLLILSVYIVRISTFYLFYSYVWPKYLPERRWLPMILWIAIGCLLFTVGRYFIEEMVYDALFGFHNYIDPTAWFYLSDNLWRILPYTFASALVFLLERGNTIQKNQLQLQQEKTTAELAFLRSQINPHFLFNTLSFLHTEAFQRDPELANTILKVSDILRYSVESTKEGKRSVAQELQLINNYIAIFRKRFDGRCYVDLQVDGEGQQQLVEPLLLIPFVENAFKHGMFSDSEHPIQIKLQLAIHSLTFTISNRIKRQTKDPSSGIGIENVRRRLEVLYPEKHQLDISTSNDDFKVVLSLQL